MHSSNQIRARLTVAVGKKATQHKEDDEKRMQQQGQEDMAGSQVMDADPRGPAAAAAPDSNFATFRQLYAELPLRRSSPVHSYRELLVIDSDMSDEEEEGEKQPPPAPPRSFKLTELPTDWLAEEPPNALICCVCTNIVWEPPNLEACGHAMCRACVNQLKVKECPLCMKSFAHAHLLPNPFVQGMVWQLRVKCRQHKAGCNWTGALGIYGRNLQTHDTACSRKFIVCDRCHNEMLRSELAEHQLKCPERQVRCLSCQQPVWFGLLRWHFDRLEGEDKTRCDGGKRSDEAFAAALHRTNSTADPCGQLLPAFIPPCQGMEVCPHGCEDENHPGHVSIWPLEQRRTHERVCPNNRVECSLCRPAHMVPHATLHEHWINDVLGAGPSRKRKRALQRIEKMQNKQRRKC